MFHRGLVQDSVQSMPSVSIYSLKKINKNILVKSLCNTETSIDNS